MNLRREPWPRRLVNVLTNNPELVKLYVIPGLLFFLDLVLRAVLGIDLIDAGADMALLAVATFIALLIEDDLVENQRLIIAILVFVIIFLVPWIICLRIVAIPQPITTIYINFIDFRLVFSWLVGMVAFVMSGIIANVVLQKP